MLRLTSTKTFILRHTGTLILILLCFCAMPVSAEKIKDDVDHFKDESTELAQGIKKDPRLVPVPMPIGNPTIGTGLGISLIYLHEPKPGEEDLPTSTSGMFIAYTNSESRMGGVFHDGHYFHDKLRLIGAVGGGLFKIKYYGVGEDSPIRDNPLRYDSRVFGLFPQALYELPVDNWYTGARYIYVSTKNTFKLGSLVPGLPDYLSETTTAGVGIVLQYDSRDNTKWASKGQFLEIVATDYDEQWAGDFKYQKLNLKYRHYSPLAETVTMVGATTMQFIDGDPPFYDLSGISLRGFPRGLFVDDHAASIEAEVRWQFSERWISTLFAGAGRISSHINDMNTSDTYHAGGSGLRYTVNREQKLNVGIDITYGNNSWEYYIVIGDSL